MDIMAAMQLTANDTWIAAEDYDPYERYDHSLTAEDIRMLAAQADLEPGE